MLNDCLTSKGLETLAVHKKPRLNGNKNLNVNKNVTNAGASITKPAMSLALEATVYQNAVQT